MKTLTAATLTVLILSGLAGCSSSKDKDDSILSTPANDEARITISSPFDLDDEGWLIAGDAQGAGVIPTHVPEQEGMSAHIVADDDVAGGTWYFAAPEKFRGSILDFYAGSLDFDLKTSTVASPFDDRDVILTSGDVSISTQLPRLPEPTFTRFSIPLTEGEWVDAAGEVIDVNTFTNVLMSIDGLQIRGEYNVGPDTGGLDNVVLLMSGQ